MCCVCIAGLIFHFYLGSVSNFSYNCDKQAEGGRLPFVVLPTKCPSRSSTNQFLYVTRPSQMTLLAQLGHISIVC